MLIPTTARQASLRAGVHGEPHSHGDVNAYADTRADIITTPEFNACSDIHAYADTRADIITTPEFNACSDIHAYADTRTDIITTPEFNACSDIHAYAIYHVNANLYSNC